MKINFGKERINNDEEKKSGFDPVECGWYAAILSKITKKPSRAGNEYFEVIWTVEPDGERITQFRKFWDNYSLTDAAIWKLRKLLIAMGHDADQLIGEFEFDPQDMVGEEAMIRLGPPDEGYNNNRVEQVENHAYDPEAAAAELV